MAIDYAKVLEKLRKKNKGGDVDYIKFEDGPTVIRIVPGHPNMEGFFVAVPHHQKGQGKTYVKVICTDLGDPNNGDCLICPSLEEYRQSDDKKIYKDQMAKDRYFFSAVERTPKPEGNAPKEPEVVKVAECGTMLLEEILNVLVDPEYVDLLDPITGLDVTVTKSGDGMETEYKVTPRRKASMIFPGDEEATNALIGTDAEDTKLRDLNDLSKQFEGEPEKALIVWEKGWKALSEDKDDDEEAPVTKKAKTGTVVAKTGKVVAKAKVAAPEPDEDEVDITSFPKLKSRCSICGDKRYKTPSGNVCANGHGGAPALGDDERPSKPSKAYLKEFPEPVEEEVEAEEEEEDEPIPVKGKAVVAVAKKKATVEPEEDDGLEELEDIIRTHSTKKGK